MTDQTATTAAPKKSRFPLPALPAAGLAALFGALYAVAFPGIGIWPLAFVAFAPLLLALYRQPPRRALWLGLVGGTVMTSTGFYWLVEMLRTFSGFPIALCALFFLILAAYQGGRMALLAWVYSRAAERGWPHRLVFLGAFALSELVYPLLFPWYFAACAYRAPALMQLAELGGPILVGLVFVGASLSLAELVIARMERKKPCRATVFGGAAGVAVSLLFGLWRVLAVDARAAAAEPVHVGLVQGNMGLMQKRDDPGEGLRRHQRLTQELRSRGVELVVWSESAVTFAVPEAMAASFLRDRVAARLGIPAIFGGVLFRTDRDRERWFNTAIATDARGEVRGRYDKQFLLAFGEYIPFGDTFPIVYQLSPNSGRFSAGTSLDPLVLDVGGKKRTISALICYEDILPSFTRGLVSHGNPELLVNLTNDAWFGDSMEPWQHLALAQLRSVEHRRYLVRATNSGVSAIIDPVGRVIANTQTFRVATLDTTVRWLRATTAYEVVGDIPWYVVAITVAVAAFRRRTRRPSVAGPSKTAV